MTSSQTLETNEDAVFYVNIAVNVLISLVALMLMIIYIKEKPVINLKRGINIQFTIAIVIYTIVVSIPNDHFFFPEKQSCDVLSSIKINIQIFNFSLITIILLYSYLVVEHTEFIRKHYNTLKIGVFSYIYLFFIVYSIVNSRFDMKTLNFGECTIEYPPLLWTTFIYLAALLIVQLFCLWKIYQAFKVSAEQEQNEEITNRDRKKIMYIGNAQAIVTIVSPIRIYLFRKDNTPLALLIIFKLIEQLGALIYLIAYAYDENDTISLKKMLTCSSDQENQERTQTLDDKLKEELVATKA